jgi:hypothetical protein
MEYLSGGAPETVISLVVDVAVGCLPTMVFLAYDKVNKTNPEF